MNVIKFHSAKEKEGYNLYAIVVDNKNLVKEYIDTIDQKNKTQLAALLNRILCKGLPKDIKRFRNLGDDIYELKTRNGARVLCFFGGALLEKSLVLTHGIDKSAGKILRREKRKAIGFRKDFFNNAVII